MLILVLKWPIYPILGMIRIFFKNPIHALTTHQYLLSGVIPEKSEKQI